MALLLDTNVISAARRPDKQDRAFQQFLQEFDVATAYLSAITIMEIKFGIEREKRNDPAFAADLERWLDGIVLPSFAGRILPFDLDVAMRAGTLATAGKRPSADAMIAATALEHGLRIATRNIADFTPFEVACFDPWKHEASKAP